MHKEATAKMAAKSSGVNVLAQLSTHHEADNRFYRECC
jgi:hypothetical protein